MTDTVDHVVVVGGGTAGWLTAGVLAAQYGGGLRVSVVESPDVPTIGVGEGTWPSIRDTLRRIGVRETDLLRECDAAFKQGSRFDRWVDASAADRYDHPFMLPHGFGEADLVGGWLAAHRDRPFASMVSAQPHVCARNLAPKQASTPEFAAVANYAYHLDAVKLGHFLRTHCTTQLGVVHVVGHVTGVEAHADGDIAALQLRDGGALAGDLFVDCTGLQSLLLGRHYGVPFRSCRDVLFNDRALALQVPYADPAQHIASQTIATAQDAGWIWDIGLPTRRGIGHVYSSAHVSDDAAEAALRAYVAATGGPADPGPARRLSFQPGWRAEFWHRNCVAIGLSAGFVEPLEASAIALVELSAAMLADELPARREDMPLVARRFNTAFAYRWGRVMQFLKLHYALSRRDGDYWRDHMRPAAMPPELSELLTLWRHRPPSRHDFPQGQEIFPTASWQYILYGMGFHPVPARQRQDATQAAEPWFRENAQLAARMVSALPGHRALIEQARRNGLPRI
jgi:hypothetical protein